MYKLLPASSLRALLIHKGVKLIYVTGESDAGLRALLIHKGVKQWDL